MTRPAKGRGARHAGRGSADSGRGRPSGRRAGQGAGGSRAGSAERARAIALLIAVERGAFAAELLAPRDGRFLRELVLGVLRRRLTLDSIAAAFGRRDLADLDDDVRAALRIGLYQLLFMDGVPPHAAVSATVGALRTAPGANGAGARAYVNALLRVVQRESHRVPENEDRGGASPRKRLHRPGRCVIFFSRPVFPDPDRDRTAWLAAVHSHPPLLVQRWVAELGESAAIARMDAGNAPAPLLLRPRLGRIELLPLAQRLLQEGVETELPAEAPHARVLLVRSGAERVFAGRCFREGLFSVQDPEQAAAAAILAPCAGEVVWDACAAPGGKTTQLAELLERAQDLAARDRGPGEGAPHIADANGPRSPEAAPRGRIVATDASDERLERLRENLARLGLLDGADEGESGVLVAAHDLLAAAAPPGRPAQGFDAILLDAPCSNTAVLARRPEARWRLRAGTLAELAALQRRLLAAAHAHLAPHGRLVYSVCTHEPEEGAGHGLRATHSPFVWTATHGELAARVAEWTRAGLLAESAGAPPAASRDDKAPGSGRVS